MTGGHPASFIILTCAVSRFVRRVSTIVNDVTEPIKGDASAVVACEFPQFAFGGAGLGQSQQKEQ